MDNDSSTTTTVASSRADIMKQIASQAATVRQNFESSKRKHSSIATAKAAEQMIARRRTAEEYQQSQSSGQTTTEQPWRMTSHIFHSHIASYTKTTPPPSSIPTSSSLAAHHQPLQQYPATSVAPRVSDGIILAVSNSVHIYMDMCLYICTVHHSTSYNISPYYYRPLQIQLLSLTMMLSGKSALVLFYHVHMCVQYGVSVI